MKSLTEILMAADAMGLTSEQMKGIEQEWVEACYRYERENPRPRDLGAQPAQEYLTRKTDLAYAYAFRHMLRTMNERVL